jgi:hypothetical protein
MIRLGRGLRHTEKNGASDLCSYLEVPYAAYGEALEAVLGLETHVPGRLPWLLACESLHY